jgi:hypothetical protein
LPYFSYDADGEKDNLGIDISKGPLRFVAADDAYSQAVKDNDTAQFYNQESGQYTIDFKIVSKIYTKLDTLKTLDGKAEVRDYPDKYTLWQYVLMAYNYPQVLAKLNYESAAPESAEYHTLFYSADGNRIPWRDIYMNDMYLKYGAENVDQTYNKFFNENPQTIKMWFLAPTLWMIGFGIAGLVLCWIKRGIATQFFPVLFGAVGIVGYFSNRILLSYSPENQLSYVIQIVMCALVLVNGIIGVIIQAYELKTRPDEYYLPMI